MLAVTAQNLGGNELMGTVDGIFAPLNARPVSVSMDATAGPDCSDVMDRVRGFTSFHSEGAYFVYGDGSVQFVADAISPSTYQALSTISGSEVVTDQ